MYISILGNNSCGVLSHSYKLENVWFYLKHYNENLESEELLCKNKANLNMLEIDDEESLI